MYTDQTSAFRALLPTSSTSPPGSSGPSTPASASSTRAQSPSLPSKKPKGILGRRKESEDEKKAREEEEAFMSEAYRIHQHLTTLRSSLHSSRKAYLSLADGPGSGAYTRRRDGHNSDSRRSRVRGRLGNGAEGLDEGSLMHGEGARGEEEDEEGDEDDAWLSGRRDRHVAYMSDKERGEVDVRGKMIVRRCRDRVAMLEEGEKARQSRTLPTPSPLLLLLHSLAPPPASSAAMEPIITAHRASVLWTLNSLLASTSKDLVDLQEERAKRKAERVRTLGDGAEKEARILQRDRQGRDTKEGFFGRALDGITGANTSGTASGSHTGTLPPDTADPSEPIFDPTSSLSSAQIAQFDTENSALLTHLSSTLSSVLAAEKSLLEISEMQTQLISHLAQQTELVDTLYEQAVGSVGEMRGAKEQLVKAKERSGEARLFLLVFLVGASLGLLFLDWYS